MINFDDLVIEDSTRTFRYQTSMGEAVLVMRLMSANNAAFIGAVLARERSRAESNPATDAPPESAAAPSPAGTVDNMTAQAADLHAWCFESLTVGGERCTREQGLEFLVILATKVTLAFLELQRSLRAAVEAKEAATEAIAGES